ncbi:glucose-6-phosphate dehydrogenase [bacterium]|nr:glucose-6-phosphate dehydrogenase [bacterium]
MNSPYDEPTTLVIFGATGDLSSRKIFPSLFYLYQQGRLPERAAIIGYSRRELPNEDFRTMVKESLVGKMNMPENIDAFLSLFSYHRGTFDEATAFESLAQTIESKEKAWGQCGNKLFYLSVPPESYPPIFQNLAHTKLNIPCGGKLGWSRVLIEKPFGSDGKTAHELQTLLSTYFTEDQLYRIDHYLFKEIVQGIEHFRFSNNLFENRWGNDTVAQIDIRLLESIGVESRGAFYDKVGAFRDVGQNHLLAMLAAITAQYPAGSGVEEIQGERAKALSALAPWTDESIAQSTYRAQYQGYQSIKGVEPGSTTETYVALKTELQLPQWNGVPIFLEAGKRTGEPLKEMVITLRHPKKCLLCTVGSHGANTITFRLEPNDEIVIKFWTKKPGFERVLEERAFSFFLYEKETKVQYVEEYSKILNAAMVGDRALFVGPDEIKAMWKFTDLVVEAWQRNVVPLDTYPPDTRPLPTFR